MPDAAMRERYARLRISIADRGARTLRGYVAITCCGERRNAAEASEPVAAFIEMRVRSAFIVARHTRLLATAHNRWRVHIRHR